MRWLVVLVIFKFIQLSNSMIIFVVHKNYRCCCCCYSIGVGSRLKSKKQNELNLNFMWIIMIMIHLILRQFLFNNQRNKIDVSNPILNWIRIRMIIIDLDYPFWFPFSFLSFFFLSFTQLKCWQVIIILKQNRKEIKQRFPAINNQVTISNDRWFDHQFVNNNNNK